MLNNLFSKFSKPEPADVWGIAEIDLDESVTRILWGEEFFATEVDALRFIECNKIDNSLPIRVLITPL